MGFFDGFPFKSREQMDRERAEFEERVFPLGLAQREKALEVLRQLSGAKVREEELLFAFINSKDIYRRAKDPELGMKNAWKSLFAQRRLKDADRRRVLALVKLDSRAERLDAYPGAEEVLAEVPSLDWLK